MIDIDTHPELIDLLLKGLHATLNGLETATIMVHHSVQHVADAQTAIGWKQLLKGRLATQWQVKQQEYLGARSDEKNNGQTWATKVVAKLLEQWLDLWNLRNSDRHGRDTKSKEDAAKRQSIRELCQLYEQKDNIPANYQWIFARPLETCLQWPAYMIRAFVNAYQPIISRTLAPHQFLLDPHT